MSLYQATMADGLLLGLPAKGRIGEDCRDFLAAAGVPLAKREERGYFARLQDCPQVSVALLSAREIVLALERGALHLGVSGRDLFFETIESPAEGLALMQDLGFSRADLRVAVPRSWIDADSMDDLADIARGFHAGHGRLLRVATKYPRLTREIFRSRDIDMYRIAASLGATEGAPRAGLAEAVVDISSTGATLRSNGLKPLADVCWPSQAQLAASRHAPWSETALQAAERPLAAMAAQAGGDGEAWLGQLRRALA